MTRVLALETSCDETAAAIVEDGRRVLANIIHTQTELHAPFGGVIPETAARQHIQTVNDCVSTALETAGMTLEDIDCFAATLGPGLIGSLLVGANTAKTLSLITGKPFRGVHHLYAHVASNYLDSDLEPPFLCLLVSGGHTQLIHVQAYDQREILGETLDDAVGEAYDKIARMMELPFPGGPALDALAKVGNPKAFALPTATLDRPYDFSFSGLKTATMRCFEKAMAEVANTPGLSESERASREDAIRADIAASFQHTVVETLFKKTVACANALGLKTITIAGGVSANRGLRERFTQFVADLPRYRLFIPKGAFCTDNAAMVAASAYFNPITFDVGQEVFSREMPVGLS